MAALYASIAPRVPVPVLWFYAENDQYIGPRVQKACVRELPLGRRPGRASS
jgi:hypothetical protein